MGPVINPSDMFTFRRSLSPSLERLLLRAKSVVWPVVVTAYLTDVKIHGRILLGVSWEHRKASVDSRRFADGHLIHTSDVCGLDRVGQHWIVETRNSHYVIVNFTRSGGRAEFAHLRHLWSGKNTDVGSALDN
jgi:hypothetical protein